MDLSAKHNKGLKKMLDLFNRGESLVEIRFTMQGKSQQVHRIRCLKGEPSDKQIKRFDDILNEQSLSITMTLEDIRLSTDLRGSDEGCIEKNFKSCDVYIDGIKYSVLDENIYNGNFKNSVELLLIRAS